MPSGRHLPTVSHRKDTAMLGQTYILGTQKGTESGRKVVKVHRIDLATKSYGLLCAASLIPLIWSVENV